MIMKRILRLSALVLVVLLALSRGGSGSRVVQAQGPTIRFPLNGNPPPLDMLDTWYNQNATVIFNQIFENMFRYAPDGTIQPAGALSYAITGGGTIYTIQLRPDARWSDGALVVARHFIDGILRLGGSELAQEYFPIVGFEQWSAGTLDPEDVGIVALDDYTIGITLEEPAIHFIDVLASEWIRYPVRLVDPSDPLGPILGPEISNGPYQLIEWVPDDYITLVKNPYYWDSGNVEFEDVYLPIIPDLYNQFDAYQSDLLDASGIPGPEFSIVLGDPLLSAELHSLPRPGVYYIGLNTTLAPTDDLDFRMALATSIDRRDMLDNYLNTPWRAEATGVIPPEMPAHQGSEAGFTYDPAAALVHLSNYTLDPSSVTVELWYNTNNFIAKF